MGNVLSARWNYRKRAAAADPEKELERGRSRRAADPERFSKQARKYAATPLGQLRALCKATADRLELGKLGKSKLKLLDYGPDEYIAHLELTLPNGMTFGEAREAGYHVDHIVPLAVINEACPTDKAGRKLAFRMAQDLDNLQMIPGVENNRKHASFNTAKQRRLFDVLSARYLA